jgi:HEAT repeat protein
MNLRLTNLFSLALCLALPAAIGITQKNQKPDRLEQIKLTINKVKAGHTREARTEAARHLASLVQNLSEKQITDTLVTDVSSLLDSPDDSVRYWVATALGNIGPAAKSSVPELEKLLPGADCFNGVITSADGIRYALTRMGVKPAPPRDCGRIAF